MLRILVQTGNQLVEREHSAGPLEIGRGPRRATPRLMLEDLYVSRDHLLAEEVEPGRLRLENISRKNAVEIENETPLSTGSVRILPLPVRVQIGRSWLRFEAALSTADANLQTVRRPLAVESSVAVPRLADLGQAPTAEVLTQWLERVFTVQRAAAGSAEFYEEAARAIVEIVGLDSSSVLLRRPAGWEVVSRYPRGHLVAYDFSQTVLAQVVRDRRSFYQTFNVPAAARSLAEVEAVIASPILDDQNQVLGVLYGARGAGLGEVVAITAIEAQVVQLLAAAVSAGLARKEREAQAARMRVQFEQFFSAELAGELERDPSMLEGREREITVLFADLRGFSAIAERVGPRETFRLMRDVMDRLTARISEFGGIVIDYYGDGVAVMWNAPADQPRHAALAAQTALALRSELPDLNQSWSARVRAVLDVGIGIHTGVALVGNCGSSNRLKYGPRGHVVNLASRLEQATKQFGSPILISGQTRSALGEAFHATRLCKARLAGISEPVDLYELHPRPAHGPVTDPDVDYHRGLTLFETGQFHEAIVLLEPIAAGGNAPAGILLNQARRQIQHPDAPFLGVVELTSK